MERIAIVVDASCDLPKSFFDEHKVQILPVYFSHHGATLVDDRQTKVTSEFYRSNQFDTDSIKANLSEADNIIRLLKEKIIPDFDSILVITCHEKRSPINHLVRETTFNNKDRFTAWRLEHGLDTKFKIKIVDSINVFSGHGLLAFETVRLLTEKAIPFENLHKPMELLKPKIQTLIATNDIQALRQSKPKKDGTKSATTKMSWMDYQVGKVLDKKPVLKLQNGQFITLSKEKGFKNAASKIYEQVLTEVKAGLGRPIVNISYAGNLAEIKTDPSFKEFLRKLAASQIKTMVSMMSITGAKSVGRGAISISYIKK